MTPAVTVIGGGMIVHDQILPSLYQLQRLGMVGAIAVCAQHGRTVRTLAANETIRAAFPGHTFAGFPDAPVDADTAYPLLYREVLARMAGRGIAVVALPDHLHFDAVMDALRADQHVLVVKPLVLRAWQAEAIAKEAAERELLVGIEYHKRLDDRSLMARRKYRAGEFGEFRLGTACLLEKWYYRHSNFQNWFTCENSDAFTYIGCHYVDLVHFITGLLPKAVSVYGVKDKLPNGNLGYLWTDARVLWENGACLNVQNALGFPDAAPGTNTQGLTMYCSAGDRGAYLRHSDQYRGLEYVYKDATYAEPSPDYFQYVEAGGGMLKPVGYGYRSIEHIVGTMLRVENAGDRRAALGEVDREGLIATPGNSMYNERVIEAGRESIVNGGREVELRHGASS